MPPDLSLPAPAKLNLFLHITGRRADGYHELQTLFQLLDHGDSLDFTLTRSGRIEFSCDNSPLDSDDNLVVRAARMLQAHSGTGLGTRIHLHKRLPAGGGLGGGSSDAASTLLALNQLWECRYSIQTLAQLALPLGADIPVFIHGQSAWAEGVGEDLSPVALPERWYVVLTPPCLVSTGAIFGHSQLTRDTPAIRIPRFPAAGLYNDCEKVACQLYPEIRAALDWLAGETGSASMTGTGASIFAAFDHHREAEAVLARKPPALQGFVAQGINDSPVHRKLALAGS